MKKKPIKRPAGRKPSVMSQVREIEAKIAPPPVKTPVVPRPKISINKNILRNYLLSEILTLPHKQINIAMKGKRNAYVKKNI